MAEMDLRELAGALRDLLAEWSSPPVPHASSTVLSDAWRAIIEPPARLAQWTADTKELATSSWWAKDEDGVATHLKPARWQQARAHLGQTYAALYGALSQYLVVRPVWRERVWFGFKPIPQAPIGSRAEVTKAREAQAKKAQEERKKAAEFYQHVLDATLKGLEEAQSRLEGQLDNVVRLTVRMQEAEERRLRAVLKGKAGLSAADAAIVKTALELMLEARQDTAAFQGAGAAFGSLLDRWLAEQRRAAQRVG